jgi:hypothetical protein
MQAWHIRVLELEAAGFEHIDGFMHGHAPGFFIRASDPEIATLNWQFVMDEMVKLKTNETQKR